MLDIKQIRENPEILDNSLAKRGAQAQSSSILALDEQRRNLLTQAQGLQQQRNALSKQVGQLKSKGEDASEIMAQVQQMGPQLKELEEQASQKEAELNELLSGIPNILQDDVPQGQDDTENEEIRGWGEPQTFDFEPKHHYELGEDLGQMDFETGVKLAGSRFVWMQGDLARLERALALFMLDHLRSRGFTEVMPPLMVNTQTMYGTGQLPKFGDDMYEMTTGEWLNPTSEVMLTNYAQDKILSTDQLPLRWCAWTPCFRKESGSAGKDTRGYIRMHQFAKVEMVQLTTPEQSEAAHEWMTETAEGVLRALNLPYRVMLLCGGDTGFGVNKTYDIEVWLPGQDTFREISSCSTCGDFQGRRMNGRFRSGQDKPQFVHTLNGSGLATGRTLVAVLENYQQADGSIVVPEVIRPYLGGQELITAEGAFAPAVDATAEAA